MNRRVHWLLALFFGVSCITIAAPTGVPDDPNKIQPILIGNKLPDVPLKTDDGKSVTLHGIVGNKPTVIVYYRGGWCPFCTQQLTAIGIKQAELEKLGFKIIAVSPDSPTRIKASAGQMDHSITLLSDSTMAGARALGIAFKLAPETVAMYKEKYRIDIEADSGETHHTLPVPSVFIVNGEGRITFHYVNPNYRVRLDPDLLTAAARAAIK